jgi:ferritin
MLSDGLVKSLNEQINAEFYASNLYLQMSAWCANKGLPGCASFLRKQSSEETVHMQRLFNYVTETGAPAVLGTVAAPPLTYKSALDIFEKTFDHERDVTKRIFKLVEKALAEKDYSTFNFLQWYVAEQHEEESLFKSILDKFKIIGSDNRGLFFIDREMMELSKVKA